MKLKIAVLEGDGIGPEIMKQGVAVLDAIAEKFGHEFIYHPAICGAHAIEEVRSWASLQMFALWLLSIVCCTSRH